MIVHISSVHVPTDTRLNRYLEHKNDILICIGKGEFNEKIKLVFNKRNIFTRILFCLIVAFKIPKTCSAVVGHDPELLPTLFMLKILNKKIKVYFDAHEDVIEDLKQKVWLSKSVRAFLDILFNLMFRFILPKFDGIITVNEPLSKVYRVYNPIIHILYNFPLRSELHISSESRLINARVEDLSFYYMGSLSLQRGVVQIVELADRLNKPLHLFGEFTDLNLKRTITGMSGWKNVVYHGYVAKSEATSVIRDLDVGLLLLSDISTFRDSLPVKIFDYASMNQLIFWTGSEQCFYKPFVENFSNIYLGSDLSNLTYPESVNVNVDNKINQFEWEESSQEFYKCVDSL